MIKTPFKKIWNWAQNHRLGMILLVFTIIINQINHCQYHLTISLSIIISIICLEMTSSTNRFKTLKRPNPHKNLSISFPSKPINLNRIKTHLLKWVLMTSLIFSIITIPTKSHKIIWLTICKKKIQLTLKV